MVMCQIYNYQCDVVVWSRTQIKEYAAFRGILHY